jgi:hypothetical protein
MKHAGEVFNYNKLISTEYYIVEHSPSLFTVSSKVTKANEAGQKTEFVNFVAETNTRERAEAIIALLQ